MSASRTSTDATRIGVGIFVLCFASHCAAPEDGVELPTSEREVADLAPPTAEREVADLAAQWTHCAKDEEHCMFSGTRRVRYGADGSYTEGTFTEGVHCAGSAFGTSSGSSFHCEYEGSDDGGKAAEDPASMPMSMPMGSMMPYVDESAIPLGDPGSPSVLIKNTSEVPSPSADGTGNFRTVCKFSHMNFDDPIIFPGKERGSHLHTFFGNTKTDAFSTQDSIRNSGNSTCRGGIANRSAYWVPAMLDAQGRPQKPEESNFYYKSGYGGLAPGEIQQVPSGLRMIAGDPKAQGAQLHGGWGCHEHYVPRAASIVDCGVGNHALMSVDFPQCWNGKDLDSSDHRSHMAYPENGACPSSHPVSIPAITFNILYKIPSSGVAGWHLASDMYERSLPGGYSVHGDWFEGWDPEVSDVWLKNCNNEAVDCHSHLLGDGREIYN